MSVNVIAIDGPAASGKSTIARLASEHLSIPYINTGNMYRAVTLYFQTNKADYNDAAAIDALLADLELDYVKNDDDLFEIVLNGSFPGAAIRSPEVASEVSVVAALPAVRTWLLEKQRGFADLGLILMEGRDIGTVVFPDAKYKFFLTASPLVRAQRRLNQEGETVDGSTVESVAKEIERRDRIDSERAVAPLKQADDAILVDSSDMTIDQVLEFIASKVN